MGSVSKVQDLTKVVISVLESNYRLWINFACSRGALTSAWLFQWVLGRQRKLFEPGSNRGPFGLSFPTPRDASSRSPPGRQSPGLSPKRARCSLNKIDVRLRSMREIESKPPHKISISETLKTFQTWKKYGITRFVTLRLKCRFTFVFCLRLRALILSSVL